MYNPFTLENKTILITGASSGIGAETAVQCSKMGAKLIITGRNKERLDETFLKLEGEDHNQISADLTDVSEIEKLVSELPELDGIVYNAGVASTKLIKFIKKNYIDNLFNVNFQGPALLSQKMITAKKINKSSSIVFISSIAANHCTLGNSMYGSTKAALTSFARYLAKELINDKIRVNTILPGTIKTPLLSHKDILPEQWANYEKLYPLNGYGEPDDVAYLVIYLLSEASKWMTGNVITIDGGLSISEGGGGGS